MKTWLKSVTVVLLLHVHVAGLILDVPRLNILNETIRSLYFHVPMWFTMTLMYTISLYYSIRYLRNPQIGYDHRAVEYANTGIAFSFLGLLTGMVWAKFAWGTFWTGDPKLNGAAITTLVYLAYFVLRGSVENQEQRNRLSAVYNIFAFAAMVPLIFIIPRLSPSLHPGSGGNPGFNTYDLDNQMKIVFYPAVIGWILMGLWIASLRIRIRTVEEKVNELDYAKN
jgi:heme exporter protein C